MDTVAKKAACDNQAVFHSWHGTGSLSTRNNLEGAMKSAERAPNGHPMSLLPAFRRNGSMQRKILPPVPDMDTQLSLSAKMIDRRTSTPRGNHSYGPFFIEHTLLAEYNLLQKQILPGVYVIPSHGSSLIWFGIIFIRQGLYQEGIFRFKLIIPDNYPDGLCPRLVFDHPVFHPLVDAETNEMDVQRGFNHKWKRNVNHIWQILLYTRRCFYKIDTKAPINTEASDLYKSDQGDGCESKFRKRVRECVLAWRDRLYDLPDTDDPHYLVFSRFDRTLHEPVRQAMLNPTSTFSSCLPMLENGSDKKNKITLSDAISRRSFNNGHSFIEPGTFDIFSSSK